MCVCVCFVFAPLVYGELWSGKNLGLQLFWGFGINEHQ